MKSITFVVFTILAISVYSSSLKEKVENTVEHKVAHAIQKTVSHVEQHNQNITAIIASLSSDEQTYVNCVSAYLTTTVGFLQDLSSEYALEYMKYYQRSTTVTPADNTGCGTTVPPHVSPAVSTATSTASSTSTSTPASTSSTTPTTTTTTTVSP